MHNIDLSNLRMKLDRIVHDYLFQVSSLRKYNYFSDGNYFQAQTTVLHKLGFSMLAGNKSTPSSKEDAFLEGSTRVFLINPIIKHLLDEHQIENDWRYGSTFAKYTLSNREYELDAFVEFVFVHDGKNIGCRFTPNSYPSEEIHVMNRDYDYLYKHRPILGFDRLSQIDELWVLDWVGLSAEELKEKNNPIPGGKNLCTYISLPDFFTTLFSAEIYEMFLSVSKSAISQADDLIALKAVPQLLPNNMYSFKDTIMNEFTEIAVSKLSYQFESPIPGQIPSLSASDYTAINSRFFGDKTRLALIGTSDFSMSFITSEYLFRSMGDKLGIDYTAIVVGYLKSVEQLAYILYCSAFEGKFNLEYWDTCKNPRDWNPQDTNKFRTSPYRHRVYCPESRYWKQEYYSHPKKSPEIGELIRFLRYYTKACNISDLGKEYIFCCLNDYREYCRNHHFHKDNIGPAEYAKVERIRNNTLVCLYYLLGAFKLLDASSSTNEQLGIADYSFDDLYQLIWQRRRHLFWVKGLSDYEGVVIYQYHSTPDRYDASGRLDGAKLQFIKCPGISEDAVYSDEIENLRSDDDYVANNTIYISRDVMPLEIRPIQAKKRRNAAKP